MVLLSIPSDMLNPDNRFYRFWSLLCLHVTCFCMEAILLIYTLGQELLYELICFQLKTGPSECVVRRDEHFENERRIVRRFKYLATFLFIVKVVAIIDDAIRDD